MRRASSKTAPARYPGMKTLFRWFVLWILALFAAAAHAEAPQTRRGPFPQAQLDAMLAPIALYPDALLSQVLMAASYPRDVVDAARWSREHSGLQGEEAVRAVHDAPWDPSVLSLVAFPQILALMADRAQWTEDLGQAFMGQPREVMDTVQQLRARADAAGTLKTNDQVLVERQGYDYVIEPASPEVVHVPYYDPRSAYGAWWWPDLQPMYWGPWPSYAIAIGSGFWFGALDWPHRYVYYRSRPWYYHGRDYRHGERWRHDGNRHWAGSNDGRSRDGQRDRGQRTAVTRPAAPSYSPNAMPRTRPTYRNERTETNAEVRNPAYRAAPVQGTAPVERRAPVERAAVERAPSVPQAARAERPARTERAAPEPREAPSNPAERGARSMTR